MRALMTLLICLLTFALSSQVKAQEGSPLPHFKISSNNYSASAQQFEELAKHPPFSDFYFNAACYWSLAGDKENAMRCLQLAANEGFRFEEWILNESDLKSLHRYKGWREVIKQVQTNQSDFELETSKLKLNDEVAKFDK